MWKLTFKYGLILFVALSAFKFLEYQFFSYRLSLELYLSIVASAFLVLGFFVSRYWSRQNPADQDAQIDQHKLAEFSPREQQVLVFIAQGYTNKEIAKSLDISPNTVKSHLKKLFDKLEVSNRTQAVAEAKLLKIIN